MRERPGITDDEVAAGVRTGFGIAVQGLEFQPIGNATDTWIFEVATGGERFFLKLKKEPWCEAGPRVAAYLAASGLPVLPPRLALSGLPWSSWREYGLILFPFVEGQPASDCGMQESEWFEFGRTVRAIHQAKVPEPLASGLERETFEPYGDELVDRLDALATDSNEPDVDWWRRHRGTARRRMAMVQAVGREAKARAGELCLCHGDLQTPNILVTPTRRWWLVDWDTPSWSPRELDRMQVGQTGRAAFEQGYGPYQDNRAVLGYLELNWLWQELLDNLRRLMLLPGVGEQDRANARAALDPLWHELDQACLRR